MRHNRALAKNLILGAVGTLMLAMTAGKSQAQIVFDGLDWTTDRGGIVLTVAPNNAGPLRAGFNLGTNNIGTLATPNQRLDSHRARLKWSFPFADDLNGTSGFYTNQTTNVTSKNLTLLNGQNAGAVGPAAQFIVDNPYLNFDKSNIFIFTDSTQPRSGQLPPPQFPPALTLMTVPPFNANFGAKTQWLGPSFTIPIPANRSGYNGFGFTFTPSDPTVPNDPYAANPSVAALNDYGYTLATHNDFTVTRAGGNTPITTAEVATFPNADPNVYSAVHQVLATELESATANAAGAHAVALWTIGTEQNAGGDIHDPYDTTLFNSPVVRPK